MRRHIGFLLLLAALAALLAPIAVDQWTRFSDRDAIDKYRAEVMAMPDEQREALLSQLKETRDEVLLPDPFIEETRLSAPADALPTVDGVMGVLEIPRIGVTLPIYRQSYWSALERGVGHVAGSSLPLGAPGSHAALAGRSDQWLARLFSSLHRLRAGDVFTVEVLGEKTTYVVDEISRVSAGQTIEPERDASTALCTLVTNAGDERLLVRGRSTKERLTAAQDEARAWPFWAQTALFALPFLAVGLACMLPAALFARLKRMRRLKKIDR